MTIEALVKVVPPPKEPCDAFDGPWDVVEAELRTALPQDYKDFARLYGSGHFMEFVRISIPRTTEPDASLESELADAREIFAEDYNFPYVMWPSRQGVLPFGSTYDGDMFFWLRVGAPDDWRIVVWGRQEPFDDSCEVLDCDFSDFLAGLATGSIRPKAFPPYIFSYEATFRPRSVPPPRD